MGGYYNFKRQDAYDLATFLHTRGKVRGGELNLEICPYCHSQKDKYKFSINLNTGAFNCLRSSCNAKGTFLELAKEVGFPLPDDVKEYFGTGKKYRTYKIEHIEVRDPAIKYCLSRGISEDICRKYEITTQKDHDNYLVIPFRDEKGEVRCIKYRKTDFDREKDSCKEWFDKDKQTGLGGKAILFGMNHCDYEVDTLVLTEGQLDSLSVATAGIKNAVSVPTGQGGTTWIPHCWDFMQKFKVLIVFGDNENGHITLVDMVRGRFPNMVIKVVREEDYAGCKDANEILQTYGAEQIKKAVENAEMLPIRQTVKWIDVAHVNLLNRPAIKTGITDLDITLSGGLKYGQMFLLTGQRGEGKSTFMQQLIVNAMKQHIPAFLYSGELQNFVIRNFTETMLLGKHERDVRDSDNPILEEYSNDLWLYDSSIIEDDEQAVLLKMSEQMILQNGCRLICLDNLMTIVSAVNNDTLYMAQSQFVWKLVQMAKKYNVVVILVAHPRKTSRSDARTDFDNDDVSGSADITNKVDVVMSYQRCKVKKGEEVDDSRRELWVTKNRETGKLARGDKAIQLKYEPGTRRITGINQRFGDDPWKIKPTEDASAGFKKVNYEQEEIPF